MLLGAAILPTTGLFLTVSGQLQQGKDIIVRNPHSTRPYQLVLEPLAVYLTIAMRQYEDGRYQGYYNVGPDDKDCVTTGCLVDMFCRLWGGDVKWVNQYDGGLMRPIF